MMPSGLIVNSMLFCAPWSKTISNCFFLVKQNTFSNSLRHSSYGQYGLVLQENAFPEFSLYWNQTLWNLDVVIPRHNCLGIKIQFCAQDTSLQATVTVIYYFTCKGAIFKSLYYCYIVLSLWFIICEVLDLSIGAQQFDAFRFDS